MSRSLLLATTLLLPLVAWQAPARAQPVTGLYIGGGGGANFMQQEQLRQTFTGPGFGRLYGKSGFDTGWTALGSVGWGFGNGVRVELEGNYRRNDYGRVAGLALKPQEEKYGGMLNALFDLDIGSPYVYPYIGVGGGYQRVEHNGFIANGALGVPFGGPASGNENTFAYQAIAGLSLPIPPVVGLSLTAEYRYFAIPGDQKYSVAIPGGTLTEKVRGDVNHSLMLGLRYAFNVAPPPPPPSAAVTPPPAAAASRTYLVFFDWDRSDLTPRARQVVAAAAQATTRVQVTRIEVNGYTDTSGTARYNQGLSVRRANSVADELVRDGVPRPAISIQGFGDTHLLVQTGPGVREPQNRRVEIILR